MMCWLKRARAKVSDAMLQFWAGLFVLTISNLAFAEGGGDTMDTIAKTSTKAITTFGNIIKVVFWVGIGLFAFGMPVGLAAKVAWGDYQAQQRMGSKVNWTSIVTHAGLGFIGGAMVVAVILTIMDKLLGNVISSAVTKFFSNFANAGGGS